MIFCRSSHVVVGGILADRVGWRWCVLKEISCCVQYKLTSHRIFLGQVPLCAIAVIVVVSALPSESTHGHSWRQQIKRIDFTGSFILIVAVVSLLVGLDRGAHLARPDWISISLTCASMVSFAVFLWVEISLAAEPVLPFWVLLRTALVACYSNNFLTYGGYLALLFYLPLFWQAVVDQSAGTSGMLLLPGVFGTVSGSLVAGFAMRATGKYYVLTLFANTLLLLGMTPIVLSTGLPWNSNIGISVGLVMCGIGNGIVFTTTISALLANISAADQAVVTACAWLFRTLGCAIGLTIASSIVQQVLRAKLTSRVDTGGAEDFLEDVQKSLDYIKTLAPRDEAFVRASYEKAIRMGWMLVLGFFLFALVSAGRFHADPRMPALMKLPSFYRGERL